MKFTLDKSISYEEAVGRMFEMLGTARSWHWPQVLTTMSW